MEAGSPAPFVEFVGRFLGGGNFEQPFFLGLLCFEGDDFLAAPALRRLPELVFVAQKILHGTEQKRAKSSPGRIRLRDAIVLQQPLEEGLSEVTRVLGAPTAPTDVGVEGGGNRKCKDVRARPWRWKSHPIRPKESRSNGLLRKPRAMCPWPQGVPCRDDSKARDFGHP